MSTLLISGGVLSVLGAGALFRFWQLEKEEGTKVGLGLKLLAGLALIAGVILLLSTGVSSVIDRAGDGTAGGGTTKETYFLGAATVGSAGIVSWDTVEDTSNENRLKGKIAINDGRVDLGDGYNYRLTVEITKVVPESVPVLSICQSARGCSEGGKLAFTSGVGSPVSITVNKYDIDATLNKQVIVVMTGAFVSADARILIEKLDEASPPLFDGDPFETDSPVDPTADPTDPPETVPFCVNEPIGNVPDYSAPLAGRLTDEDESYLGFYMTGQTGLPVEGRPYVTVYGSVSFDVAFLSNELALGFDAPCSAISTTKGKRFLEIIASEFGGQADDYLMFCSALNNSQFEFEVESILWFRSVNKGAPEPTTTNFSMSTSMGVSMGFYFGDLFASTEDPAPCLADR